MYSLEQFKQRKLDDQRSLTEALAWASRMYYVENNPPMEDYEFDMEFKQLQALEAASGIVLPGSPTQRVGSDIQGGFEKRKHIIPMQSIENVYDDGELQSWLETTRDTLRAAFPSDDISFTYEPKYDGVSISLIYTDGILTDAVTRGNQIEGESVFENVKTIRNIPLLLDREVCPSLPTYFEVRGEVLMTEEIFARLNAEKERSGERPFANKRNAAAGSLKQLDPKVTARRGLIINAFAAYSTDESFVQQVMPSQVATLHLLRDLGFAYYKMDQAFTDIDALCEEINAFNLLRKNKVLPYDCDGVVVKLNHRKHQQYMGLNTTFPNWCKARKFPQEATSTLLLDVTFQVGMTGHITPVAELEPTVISGSLVSRATLNNENYIRSLDLCRGSYVFVQKAGEVIPQVLKADTERNESEGVLLTEISFPQHCPSCHTSLIKKGEYWVCPNHHCREQVIQRLEYWCGKDCAGIKGIGRNIVADFVDILGISSINDLYQTFILDEDAYEHESEELLRLSADAEGFAPDTLFYQMPTSARPSYRDRISLRLGEGYAKRSVDMIFDGIRQSVETLTLDKIIGGFGIDGVGKITGRLLAAHFGSLESFRMATSETLMSIEGIGEIMANNILEFLAPGGHIEDYSILEHPALHFKTTFEKTSRLGSALEGKTILFTGTSYRFKREELKSFFTAHGAKYVGSVSGKVDYLVTGNAPGQNKLDKAAQLKVEIIDEREFYERFGL